MKKLLIAAFGLLCASTLVVNAQDATTAKPAKHELTAEQQALRKEMLEKYDANKDGRLDKEERAKMTQEDKDKMQKAGIWHDKKGKGKGEKKAE